MNTKFIKSMPIPIGHSLLDIVIWGRALFGQEEPSSYLIGLSSKKGILRFEPIWGFHIGYSDTDEYRFDFSFKNEGDYTLFVLTWG